ncbi:MAG: GNAT family N-acetyltransferase [Saprospiraceae bacterium]|nr:GNAT family N-acetyltransferase [Saprospiraceae bacterium]
MLKIIPYHPDFQSAFESLNRAWIEAHFELEPEDIRVITQPKSYILDAGGAILMAMKDEEVVGTVSLKKVDDTTFEMVKMTVDERFRGNGYGKILCEAIIEQAKKMGGHRMVLYSNTIHAGNAINMYRQMGFFEADLEKGKYERADIKMEKSLLPMDKAERERLVESYGKAYDKIVATLAEYPRDMWQWRPAADKWTIHENIVHLADSEANSYIRSRRFIAEPGSLVLGYDQEVWTKKLDYHQQSVEDALELFRLLRKKSYDLIKNLPDEVWKNTVEHSENGTMTFEDWLRVYENHTHIGSMRRVFEAWKRQHSLTS